MSFILYFILAPERPTGDEITTSVKIDKPTDPTKPTFKIKRSLFNAENGPIVQYIIYVRQSIIDDYFI